MRYRAGVTEGAGAADRCPLSVIPAPCPSFLRRQESMRSQGHSQCSTAPDHPRRAGSSGGPSGGEARRTVGRSHGFLPAQGRRLRADQLLLRPAEPPSRIGSPRSARAAASSALLVGASCRRWAGSRSPWSAWRRSTATAADCAAPEASGAGAPSKPKKLALTACMRKLLVILNAMLKHHTPWDERTAHLSHTA